MTLWRTISRPFCIAWFLIGSRIVGLQLYRAVLKNALYTLMKWYHKAVTHRYVAITLVYSHGARVTHKCLGTRRRYYCVSPHVRIYQCLPYLSICVVYTYICLHAVYKSITSDFGEWFGRRIGFDYETGHQFNVCRV